MNYIKLIKKYLFFGKKSQGLLETLIALGIIAASLVGSISLATYVVKSGTQSRERIQATFLAQESIEYIRYKRDSNWLPQNNNWNDGINGTRNIPGNNLNIIEEELNEYYPLTNEFNNFTRSVDIINHTDQIEIKVIIGWKESGTSHNIEVADHLTNWMP